LSELDGKFDSIRARKRAKKKPYALKLILASIVLAFTLIGDYGPSITKSFPEWLQVISLVFTLPVLLIFGVVEGGKFAVFGFFKASAKYLFQASGAVLALVLRTNFRLVRTYGSTRTTFCLAMSQPL